MYHIGLLAKPCFSRHKIQQKLLESKEFYTSLHSDPNELLRQMNHSSFDAFVFVNENVSSGHLQLFDSLNYNLENMPLIVIANHVPKKLRQAVIHRNYPLLRLIDRKYELNDLPTMLEKMILGRTIGLRHHCRYRTIKSVSVHSKRSGHHLGRLENISQGGAKIRLNYAQLENHEPVTVKVSTSSGDQHKIDSKIVWQSHRDRSCGVQFNV